MQIFANSALKAYNMIKIRQSFKIMSVLIISFLIMLFAQNIRYVKMRAIMQEKFVIIVMDITLKI